MLRLSLRPLAVIIETNRLPQWWMQGCYFGPLVLARPLAPSWIVAHELEHVRQWWRLPFLHDLCYWMDRGFRADCEIAAYRRQVEAAREKGGGAMADWMRIQAADMLFSNYDLRLSRLEIKERLE